MKPPYRGFLPDLCTLRATFLLIVLSEILAFLIHAVREHHPIATLDNLALLSICIQIFALSAAAALCLLRRWLGGRSEFSAILASCLAIPFSTALISEAMWLSIGTWEEFSLAIRMGQAEFILRNTFVSAVVGALLLRYLYVQHHWQKQIKAESEARIEALQARIRPHFLFNCLNTIASLCQSRPDLAEVSIEDLAEIFRASLSDLRTLIPLSEEIRLVEDYLRLEALRLGERLRVEWRIEDLPRDPLIPPLTLQPLVENGVYHGIEPSEKGGVIRIAGRQGGDGIHIEIDNPLPPRGREPRKGNRIAHDNIRHRLEAHFGEAASLKQREEDGRYLITLQFPLQVHHGSATHHPHRR